MNSVIFSPHTDDAIFSLGDHIMDNVDFTIASAFAGIPTDTLGYNKHTLLRKEHEGACNLIDARVINGDLLDDVYGKQDENTLTDWIKSVIINFDKVYIPLGIHHPDHIFLSNTLLKLIENFSKTYFLNRLRKLIPTLQMEDIVASRCGIRAMALGPEGEMLDDFKIEKHGNAMHVINSPSPAATASMAYGNEIALMATEYFNLK